MANYYQPGIETMPYEQLKQLQNERLVKQVKHVWLRWSESCLPREKPWKAAVRKSCCRHGMRQNKKVFFEQRPCCAA